MGLPNPARVHLGPGTKLFPQLLHSPRNSNFLKVTGFNIHCILFVYVLFVIQLGGAVAVQLSETVDRLFSQLMKSSRPHRVTVGESMIITFIFAPF